MEQKAVSGGGVSNPSRSANTKTSLRPQILFTISASSLFLHDRNDKESHAIGARCKFLGALFSTVHGAWFAEKHLHTLKSLNCTVGWCITRIRKSACSYGRPANKKRPTKGLEDPIGSRTRHDFIIV